jgi:hypothetical protein
LPLALEAIAAPVHDMPELESVIAAHAREPNGSLIVMPDGFLNVHRAEIVLLAARYHLPAIYPWRLAPLSDLVSGVVFGVAIAAIALGTDLGCIDHRARTGHRSASCAAH